MLDDLADVDDQVGSGPRVWLPPIPSAQDHLRALIKVDGVYCRIIAGGVQIPRQPVPREEPDEPNDREPVVPGRQVAQVRGVLAERVVISTALDPFLSIKALIAYSGFSRGTLLGFMADPDNPCPYYQVQPGGKIVVKRSEFDAWLLQFRRTQSAFDALIQQRRVARAARRAHRQGS